MQGISSRILHTSQGICCWGAPIFPGKSENFWDYHEIRRKPKMQNLGVRVWENRAWRDSSLPFYEKAEVHVVLSLVVPSLEELGFQVARQGKMGICFCLEPNRQMFFQLPFQTHEDSPPALHRRTDLSRQGNGDSLDHVLHTEWRVCLRW